MENNENVPAQTGNAFIQSATNKGGAIEIAAAAAKAEIEAAIVVAKKFPRDELIAYEQILKACERKGLAETARYTYPRGGTKVQGPSIRIAEVIAQKWGNLRYGIVERERRKGESTMVAYAHDIENNTYSEQVFTVRHWRDTRAGGHELNDERDIYEITANQGSRRVRACLLRVIPPDIVEEALAKCEETLKNADKRPIQDKIREMVLAFDKLGVSIGMLEGNLGHKLEATTETELVNLRGIYQSIRDGMSDRKDWFTLAKPASASSTTAEPEEPRFRPSSSSSSSASVPANKREAEAEEFPPGLEPEDPNVAAVEDELEGTLIEIKNLRDEAGIHFKTFDAELRRRGFLSPGQGLNEISLESADKVLSEIDSIIKAITIPE